MREAFEIIAMAVFQGVAEFLPISSSGHLAMLGNLFHFDPESNAQLGIILHCGTLLAIAAFYFRRICSMLEKRNWRFFALILIGSIPAGVIGIPLKKFGLVERLYSQPLVIGVCFILTGVMLFCLRKMPETPDSRVAPEALSLKGALFVGAAQAIALLPGISRSGSTIVAGRRAGFASAAAAEYSFFLALVAIGGASLLEIIDMAKGRGVRLENPGLLLLGLFFSALTGYFALKLLLKLLKSGKLSCFAYYLWFAGALVLYYGFTHL